MIAHELGLFVRHRGKHQDRSTGREIAEFMPYERPDMQALAWIAKGHRFRHLTVIEMHPAAAGERHEHHLRLAMAMLAAPEAPRHAIQPEDAPGKNVEPLARFDDTAPA